MERAEKKRMVLQELKTTHGCADCGYNERPEALDFDHLPGMVKSFPIGPSMTRSLESLLAEAAKCEVVCANCHRIRTADRKRAA